MSLNRIRSLVAGALTLLTEAELAPAAEARILRRKAKGLLTDADVLAERCKVGVVHPQHGYGVLLGVGADGLADVTFGGEPFAVALPLDSLTEDFQ